MQLIAPLLRSFSAPRRASRYSDLRAQLSFLSLEERVNPSGVVDLGVASQFGVLGLQSTAITNAGSVVTGDVGVSQNGSLQNGRNATITGDVIEYASGQYSGRGTLTGSLVVDPTLMTESDQDAQFASAVASALTPTQSLNAVRTATTLTGNGGVNVINVARNITASLTLNGTADDVFVINVSGSLRLGSGEGIRLAGGVTADHVILNFVGSTGSVNANRAVINGTVLAPTYSVDLRAATVNGEIIAGGTISIAGGTQINAVAFNAEPPIVANASISGRVFVDGNGNQVFDEGDGFDTVIGVTLTGFDDQNNPVSLTAMQDENGFFSFTELSAGTYTLTFTLNTEPSGIALVGSVTGTGSNAGTVSLDGLSVEGIICVVGSVASGYNFAAAPNQS